MDRTTRTSKLTSPQSDGNTERLLRRPEAARYLGVSVRWLDSLRDIPVVNLAGATSRRSMPRYRRSDLDRFVEQRSGPNDGRRR